MKIEVLKKTIRVCDREGNVEKIKTAYITDPKQIKQFKKRKSKKEVREAKRKGGPSKKKRPASPSSRMDESSLAENSGRMIIKIQPSNTEEERVQEAEEPVFSIFITNWFR